MEMNFEQRQRQQQVLLIKREIKRIRRSGTSAIVLCWLLLVGAVVADWFLSSKQLVLAATVTALMAGIFLFVCGNYIIDGYGRRTKLLLLLTAILCFPLSVFLVPIYVCVQAANNYSRFKDLPLEAQRIFNRPKKFRPSWLSLSLLIILIAACLAVGALRFNKLNKIKPASGPAVVDKGPKTLNLPDYSFSITFPGTPSANDFTTNQGKQIINYTTFVSHNSDGSQDFDVYAYNWPEKSVDFDKLSPADLKKTINKAMADFVKQRGGTITTTGYSTFLNRLSGGAEFSSPTLAKPVVGYIRIFFIGHYQYEIIALGSSQNDFINFANSFKYTGP